MCVCVRAFCVCECVFLLYPSSHSLYLCFVFSMSITSLHLILATLYCSCSFALAIFGWITSISIVMSSLVMKIQKLCAIIYWNIIEVDSLSNSIMTKSNFKMYNFFACTFSHWSGKNEREKKDWTNRPMKIMILSHLNHMDFIHRWYQSITPDMLL